MGWRDCAVLKKWGLQTFSIHPTFDALYPKTPALLTKFYVAINRFQMVVGTWPAWSRQLVHEVGGIVNFSWSQSTCPLLLLSAGFCKLSSLIGLTLVCVAM